MGYGVESAMLWGIGVLIMPEWCATNWGSLEKVSYAIHEDGFRQLLQTSVKVYLVEIFA